MGVRAVFLVGFMASGKSSVGLELARRLRWNFVDLDTRIECRERQSVPQIFAERGEAAFRAAETAALNELLASLAQNSVVALGGGAFAQVKNRELLRSWPSVFLEAPVDELWRRSSGHEKDRPLRTVRDQFVRLYQDRLPCYREATFTVDTLGKDLNSICTEIEGALQLVRTGGPGDSHAEPVNPATGE